MNEDRLRFINDGHECHNCGRRINGMKAERVWSGGRVLIQHRDCGGGDSSPRTHQFQIGDRVELRTGYPHRWRGRIYTGEVVHGQQGTITGEPYSPESGWSVRWDHGQNSAVDEDCLMPVAPVTGLNGRSYRTQANRYQLHRDIHPWSHHSRAQPRDSRGRFWSGS